MDLQEAKDLLDKCQRYELRDHAFGDTEVSWFEGSSDDSVASGYFSGSSTSVSIWATDDHGPGEFTGDDARQLRNCGTEGQVERNDETGPEDYQEGVTMPGLTLEGVLKEITTPPKEQ